jgi:hypothetical protein
MGKHPLPAEAAPATGGDTGDKHFITFMKINDILSHFLDYPDSFMTQDPTVRHCWNVAFQDVKVGTTDGSHRDPNNCVRFFLNFRFRF